MTTGPHPTARILHLSALPVWPLEGKGGMPSLRETLRGHVAAGHHVTLVLPQYQLFELHPRPVSVRQDEGYDVHLAPCRWIPGLLALRRAARRLGGGKDVPFAPRWVLNLLTFLLLTCSLVAVGLRLRYRTRRRFDLVYAHNQYAALAGWILGRIFRVPNVTRLYGTFLADLMTRPLVWLRYPVAAAGYLVPHSLLICCNDGTRGDEVARRLGIDLGRFRFWQNGVDMPALPPDGTRESYARTAPGNLRLGSLWAVCCSRLSYWKRTDRILRALKVARDAGADCQLLVAGDGAERPRLEDIAASLGLEADVVWLGALAHDDIWRLMHLADVFVIANDVTNRCNPLYEAICAGLPVVSVVDPSTADLLKHRENALLADKDEGEAMGRSLAEFCRDPSLRAKLGQAQRPVARRLWNWEERLRVEVADLEELVRSSRAGGNSRSPSKPVRTASSCR